VISEEFGNRCRHPLWLLCFFIMTHVGDLDGDLKKYLGLPL
jgi:hypothetical protein